MIFVWLYCRDERFHIPEVKILLILFTISLFIQYTFNEIKQYCQIKNLQICKDNYSKLREDVTLSYWGRVNNILRRQML